MRPLLLAFLLAGCEGERVETTSIDSGSETTVETGGTCDEIPGNVVPNGSFEELVGDANVASWSDARLVPVTGDADHCARYAKMLDVEPWSSLSERIAITANTDDTIEFGASVRVLDGNYTEIGLTLGTPDDTQVTRPLRALSRDKTWVRVAASLKLTAPITEIIIGIGTNVPTKRSIAIDRVWLVKK